jgi:hypothetical protein
MSIWRYEAWEQQWQAGPIDKIGHANAGFGSEADFIDLKWTLEDRGCKILPTGIRAILRYEKNSHFGKPYEVVAFFKTYAGKRIVVTRRPAVMGDM